MAHSNRAPRVRKVSKPKKPYPDFPLTPHATGAWQKKINGQIHYFGRWGHQVNGELKQLPGDDWWKPALRLFNHQFNYIIAGRKPPALPESDGGEPQGLTVADLCNEFLSGKEQLEKSGEISPKMFAEYREATDQIVEAFKRYRLVDDLQPSDFGKLRAKMARRWGPTRLKNVMTRIKSVFKFATDNGLTEKLVRYGSQFDKPTKAILRKNRAAKGERLFERDEILKMLEVATVELKAMILLGLNCGFGNTDVGRLPIRAIDLKSGWVDFPRPKTGIARRCWLWPETVNALKQAIDTRPKPALPEYASLVFLRPTGKPLVEDTKTSKGDRVTVEFSMMLKKHGLHRPGLGFYTLRHTFRTIADEARDPTVANLIMGHADSTMADYYRERIGDDRIRAVAQYVREWLFGKGGAE